MVAQMRAQYESFVAPVVTVTILLKHSTVICMKIKNAGHSSAKHLKLSIDKDFYQFGKLEKDKNIRNFPTFQRAIPSFSPGEEIFFMLSQGSNLGKLDEGREITPLEFTVDVQFEFGKQTFAHRHEIDLRVYMKTSQDKSEILDEMEKIRKVLEKQA
jgi:hypothetical protein